MTLEELKEQCETQGYQPNRATVLKLLTMIRVLCEGHEVIAHDYHQGRTCGYATDIAKRSLAQSDAIARSL